MSGECSYAETGTVMADGQLLVIQTCENCGNRRAVAVDPDEVPIVGLDEVSKEERDEANSDDDDGGQSIVTS